MSHAVQLNPLHIVIGEIQNVVSAMRLNSRWASRSTLSAHEPLLAAFQDLRATLDREETLDSVDAHVYLKPFLNVIRSEETSGPITGVALGSLQKFVSSLINENSVNVSQAMYDIGYTVTHCRFEATDPDSDEVVLMKILQVLLACIRGAAGHLISDDMIFEMVQTCYRMAFQGRLSELLRKIAESTLQDVLISVFVRYGEYDADRIAKENEQFEADSIQLEKYEQSKKEAENAKETKSKNIEEKIETKNENSTTTTNNSENNNENKEDDNNASISENSTTEFVNPVGVQFAATPSHNSSIANQDEFSRPPRRPYGIRCLNKLFSWLCGLMRPSSTSGDSGDADARSLGLALINALLEHRGCSLQRFPSLLLHIQDTVCHCLLQTLLGAPLNVLTLALRVLFNLYSAMRTTLKSQIELLLRTLIELASRAESPYEHRELVLESLSELCRLPSFAVDMYVNYDCDMHCENVYESLCKFFYKHAFPSSGALHTIHLLALDCLLSLLANVQPRSPPAPVPRALPSAASLRDVARAKAMLRAGAAQFNTNSKTGVQYLLQRGIVAKDRENDGPDAGSMARFLRTAPALDAVAVGEFLGKNKPLNLAVLEAYLSTFDDQMASLGFIGSLRAFMESFHVPGEAQIIGRVLEMFATHFFQHGNVNNEFANIDAVYVLAYSTVLLNVDQHSGKVKRPMTVDGFAHNNRGLNGRGDFPRELLVSVFNSIHAKALRVPEESTLDIVMHGGTPGGAAVAQLPNAPPAVIAGTVPKRVWEDLLGRGRRHAPFIDACGSAAYDRELFNVLWRPLLAALSVVFDTAPCLEATGNSPRDAIVCQALAGFEKLADAADRFGIGEASDAVVTALCKFTTLLPPSTGNDFDRVALPPRSPRQKNTTSSNTSSTVNHSNDDASSSDASQPHKPNRSSSQGGLPRSHSNDFGTSSQSDTMAAAVRFGRDPKARRAAIAAFSVASTHSTQLTEAWRCLLSLLARLNEFRLVSQSIFQLPALYDTSDPQPSPLYRKVAKPKSSGGSLIGWLFSSAAPPPTNSNHSQRTPRHEQVALDIARTAVDRCAIEQLLNTIATLPDNTIQYLVRTLCAVPGTPSDDSSIDFPLPPNAPVDGSTTAAESAVEIDENDENVDVRRDGVLALPDALYTQLLTFTLLQNAHRVKRLSLWDSTREHLVAMLGSARRATPLAELHLNALLLLAKHLASADEGQMCEPIILPLAGLLNLDRSVQKTFAEHIVCGATVVLRKNASLLVHHPVAIEALMSLLSASATHRRAAAVGFDALCRVIGVQPPPRSVPLPVLPDVGESKLVTKDSFACIERAAFAYACADASDSPVAIRALECLYVLHCRVRSLVGIKDLTGDQRDVEARKIAWQEFWLPLLRHLCAVCTDARLDVRNAAMMILQRALLGEDLLALGPEGWYACFAEVLFPLSDALLRVKSGEAATEGVATKSVESSGFLLSPVLSAATGVPPKNQSRVKNNSEAARGDPLEETRLRASALLCKIFLHYASTIRPSPEFNALWDKVLKYIEKYMQADDSELLAESVPESLKNILLVMSDSEVLKEPSNDGAVDDFGLWQLTWGSIARFCPDLTPQSLGIGTPAAQPVTTPTPSNNVDNQQQQPNNDNNNNNNNNNTVVTDNNNNNNVDSSAPAVAVEQTSIPIEQTTPENNNAPYTPPQVGSHFTTKVQTQIDL